MRARPSELFSSYGRAFCLDSSRAKGQAVSARTTLRRCAEMGSEARRATLTIRRFGAAALKSAHADVSELRH